MGNAKLLVLGIGTTAGVFAQTAVLLVAIRREHISLRPCGESISGSSALARWPPRWCSMC